MLCAKLSGLNQSAWPLALHKQEWIILARSATAQAKPALAPAVPIRDSPIAEEESAAPDRDRQHLHRSLVPTMHFQKSLPRLPIPKLEKTLERYVRACEPLITAEQLAHTKKYADEFGAGVGRELQTLLLAQDKRNKQTSYISDLWFDIYLRARLPLVINYNAFISMNDDPNPGKMDQAVRAADLLTSALRFKNSLRESLLEPDVYHMNPKKSDTHGFRRLVSMLPPAVSWYGAYLYKAFPLDMSQYIRLFNATRIPKPEKDQLFDDPQARHVAVLRQGHFYTFDVYDKSGDMLPSRDVLKCLEHILKENRPPDANSIAVMSADERNRWAAVRAGLVQAGNEGQLRRIDSAVFMLCLDTDTSPDKLDYCKNMLHGDGYSRWFDKSFSLAVDGLGRAGVSMEHSWGDGVSVLRLVNEIHKDAQNHNFSLGSKSSSGLDPAQHVNRIDFQLTDKLRGQIQRTREDFNRTVAGLDLSILEYHGYGKEEIKNLNFYPDGMMQLAFQMAYYKVRGGVAPTYESCSTAAFKHGRTECIRSATPLTHRFSRLVQEAGRGQPTDEMYTLLKQCSDNHGQLTKEAAMGNGFDRHLLALRKLAEADGTTVPLFTDPAYARMGHNILSTSTLQSPAIAAGGFGPVVSDGFGLGYSCMDHWMGCVVFYYKATQNGHDFTQAVNESFDDIMRVMNSKKPEHNASKAAAKS